MHGTRLFRLSEEKRISVALAERSYEVTVAPGACNRIAETPELTGLGHVFVISDDNVTGLYWPTIEPQLMKVCDTVESIVIPAGEASKSVAQLEHIWNQLLTQNADRSSTIIALGGGVVGDLAGFAAATFGRGINFIQIPTSLLAQVDSSVGGKTGINLPGAKNMVGAFWQPKFVLIDPNVLATLDEANYRSGLAEVVKYGVIMDAQFFAMLENNVSAIMDRDPEILTAVIAKCCELKAEVVKEDELETSGRRAILNYGHTFGHAIENVFGYGKYLHGEAVAIGMHCAAKLAKRLGMVESSFVDRQRELLQQIELPTAIEPGNEKKLLAAMHRDKKVAKGTLRLILPTQLGEVKLIDSPGDEVLAECFVDG